MEVWRHSSRSTNMEYFPASFHVSHYRHRYFRHPYEGYSRHYREWSQCQSNPVYQGTCNGRSLYDHQRPSPNWMGRPYSKTKPVWSNEQRRIKVRETYFVLPVTLAYGHLQWKALEVYLFGPSYIMSHFG